jgi:hypothetical protein
MYSYVLLPREEGGWGGMIGFSRRVCIVGVMAGKFICGIIVSA